MRKERLVLVLHHVLNLTQATWKIVHNLNQFEYLRYLLFKIIKIATKFFIAGFTN